MALKAHDSISCRIAGLWYLGKYILEPCQVAIKWLKTQDSNLDFGWEQLYGHYGREACQTKWCRRQNDEMQQCAGAFKWEDMIIAEYAREATDIVSFFHLIIFYNWFNLLIA